ncbi:GNAT family N-acetyltransferase [Salibaculum sp.]|uniref:GNAT family N-acetyltransferase n=1 Tax=Salibaculum sp. TaxID=2855480 RepID=UPI002B492873|nr:GNAT family N-acetyltransferase [Salibaculum sp.]HKL70902.1 GNAT family N-acetyltransferase [Salibaculum sp.]
MTPAALTDLIDATWPAAYLRRDGPWTIRAGKGGGSRVSAATAHTPPSPDDIPTAEAAMRALGQVPLFMLRDGEEVLDAALAERGYGVKDPVTLYAAPVAQLALQPPPITCFRVWPPLAAQREIWAAGGIGPERIAIMDRAGTPKTTILGRCDDTPAGTLFVALHGRAAMVHAIEIPTRFRRRGMARLMVQGAAVWSQEAKAKTLAVLVTKANIAANALYSSLGMRAAAGYHYRIHPET